MPKDTGTDALADELRRIIMRIYRQIRHQPHSTGLSAHSLGLLLYILEKPGVGVTDLAAMEGVRSPTMTNHIKQLEAAGFVTRLAAKDDRRRAGLYVTEKATERVKAFRKQRVDWLANQLATLSPESRALIQSALGPLSEIADD